MNYRATPYLRLLIPFAAGIAAGCVFDRTFEGLPGLLAIHGLIVCLLARRRYDYRRRWWFGVVAGLFLFQAGYNRAVWHNELRQPSHVVGEGLPDTTRVYVGWVYEAPSRGKRLKVPLRLEAELDSAGRHRPVTGQVLFFLAEDSIPADIRYGDRWMVSARLLPTEGPQNPHAFNYGRYLHFQNIHLQAFVGAADVRLLERTQGYWWWQAAYDCRDRLLALLHHYFPTVDEFSVASALLVGYKDDLSEELRTAYAETGSMHALAVSGTHVGFLYAGLLFLLGRLPVRGRSGYLLKAAFILLAIWSFTLLTGATASVMRASVMFSFYLIGKAIRRDTSIWNVLAASAFALLLWNPYFLCDAGFQLSYAAVAGMVFFYPWLYKWSPILPGRLDEGWKVLLVGVAAQIGTLPLSLYYFHQFPCYFWLAGWVVVLGGAIFLWGGAVLVLLDLIVPGLAVWAGEMLYWLVWAMNFLILKIQQLPGSVVSGIWLPVWGAALSYLAMLCCMAAMETRQTRWWLGLLFVLASLFTGLAVRTVSQTRQQQIVIYNVKGGRLIDWVQGFELTSFSDSLPSRQVQFAAQANRWALGVARTKEIRLDTSATGIYARRHAPFLALGDHTLVVIDHKDRLPQVPAQPIRADILLLSQNARVRLSDCLQHFSCRQIIADPTNSRSRVARWKDEAAQLGIRFHDIRSDGAAVLNF